MKIIYIKYGELTLKGKNKKLFINQIFFNIKKELESFPIKISKNFDSMYLECLNDENFADIINLLKKIPGIGLIIPSYSIDQDMDLLINELVQKIGTLNAKKTFKVQTKRQNKNYSYNSMEFSKELGHQLLIKIPNLKVDVKHPEISIIVEIKNNNFIYYFEKIKGLGGFPVGCGGKILILISGGLDSPIAAHLLLKKGYKVDFLTFISPPHTTDQALQKVRDLIKKIMEGKNSYIPKLYVVSFTKIQHEISHISDSSYQITIMRRYFFRIAEYLKNLYGYDAIATGESLGQVASQTIQSINTIENVLENTVVLRPLLTFDKMEIINISKEIGTYDISILPFADSCSLFVPTNPVTKPNSFKANMLENNLELINDIYNITVNKEIKIEKIK